MNITVLCSIWHFRDGADEDEEYEYDENGNMTKDLNSNISLVEYNFLNLPSRIEFMDGSNARYTYDATGRKLSAEYLKAGTQDTLRTDYCGNLIYEQGSPKMLLVDGGYVTFNDSLSFGEGWGGASYHYYLKDHLGNNRVVVNSNDSIEQVNHYYPYGGLMAESTGGDTQRYKYNSKELDRMHGLDWYDYGARWMNGLTFTTPDPKAWDYTDVSPYVYCHNNPISRIDPDGRDDYYLYPNGLVKHIKGSESNNQTDRLFVKGSKNSTSITIDSGILNQLTSKKNGADGHQASIKNSNDAFKLFKFVADNSDVEWSLKGFSNHNVDSYQLSTSNNQNSVKVTLSNDEISTLKFDLHSHPRSNGKENASGYDSGSNRNRVFYSNYYDGDRSGLISILGKYQHLKGDVNMPRFYIYNARTHNLFQYDWENASYNKKHIIYHTQFGGIVK